MRWQVCAPTDVLNTNASGPGSLTQAVAEAAANPGPDTITFCLSGTFDSGVPLVINDAGGLTIDGAGQSVTISGGGVHQVIEAFVTSTTLTLQDLIVANGRLSGMFSQQGAGMLGWSPAPVRQDN